MIVLSFPDPEDFIEYLKEHDIHRFGIVSICEVVPSALQEGDIGIYKEFFRLSSIDDNEKELLHCEILYYRSVFVTDEHNKKESKEPKEKMLKALNKKIKEWTEGYNLKLLHCQFGE